MMLDLNTNEKKRPPVLMVTSTKNEGIEELIEEIKSHYSYLKESKEYDDRRQKNLRTELIELVEEEIRNIVISETNKDNKMENAVKELADKKIDPFTVRDKFLNNIKK